MYHFLKNLLLLFLLLLITIIISIGVGISVIVSIVVVEFEDTVFLGYDTVWGKWILKFFQDL